MHMDELEPRASTEIKPLLFVAMPFGKKTDPKGLYNIDFDEIYEQAIRPAAKEVGINIIRADEERSGGIIHIPMFERLLLAEIVIADLTFSNANVFYELGIRHSSKPRSTILIFAKDPNTRLPFDVTMLRAIPYIIQDGDISEDELTILKDKLIEKLGQAIRDLESVDSPLFQLIHGYPGISLPHDVTESFRDRAYYIDSVRKELKASRLMHDKTKARETIREIERSLGDFNEACSELMIDLMLSYRDIEAFDDMISLIERMPSNLASIVTVREQYAFALNRRDNEGDKQRAIDVLKNVFEIHGHSSESCGLLGRIYKDFYFNSKEEGEDAKARAYLKESIKWYKKGFEDDPRDYYPGINAATLLYIKGDEEAMNDLQMISPSVMFALTRRGGLTSDDYWDVATVLEAAILGEDWVMARRAIDRILVIDVPDWNIKTTLNNLDLILVIREERGLPNEEIEAIRKILRSKIT